MVAGSGRDDDIVDEHSCNSGQSAVVAQGRSIYAVPPPQCCSSSSSSSSSSR